MDTNIIIAAVTAFIVSVVYCRISAVVTFETIDKYVVDIIEMAKESIRNAYKKDSTDENNAGFNSKNKFPDR